MNRFKFFPLILSFLFSTHAFGAAVIFSGTDVQALASNLDLNGVAKFLTGTTDPSSSAPETAPKGSLYLRTGSSGGTLYQKQDAGSTTNWTILATGAAITSLTGDVTASGPGASAATVALVNGSTAANVHAAELLANAATNANTVSTIVKRDSSGNFTAGTITAALTGNASTATSATSATTATTAGNGYTTGTSGSTLLNMTNSMSGTGNTVLGNASGSVLSTAAQTTLLGNNVGNVLTTGGRNTAVGYGALGIDIIGANNVAIGYNALGSNTAGSNVAIGHSSANSNGAGTRNVDVGLQAGYSGTGANDRVSVGHNACFGGTGSNLTCLGSQAGLNLTSGGSNLLVGKDAGDSWLTTQTGFATFGSNAVPYSNVCFGQGCQNASAAAYTINGVSGAVGTTDNAGAALQLAGGAGTGAGAGGSVILKTAKAAGSASTANTLTAKLTIDQYGHLIVGGTAPTITAACGTSPSVAGTDVAGTITVGTGGTDATCTLSFANTWAATPKCFLNNQTDIVTAQAVPSTTALVINKTIAFSAGAKLDYFCISN